ncbi:MAG: hypothetical protein E7668_06165 [Ruminococcaceae bacterium]|nr:hypothetical protein [Oscillospiraceae bacterium]
MSKRKQKEWNADDGSYVVKKNRKLNVIAFVVCFLIALVIWIYATNTEDKNKNEMQSGSTVACDTQVAECVAL